MNSETNTTQTAKQRLEMEKTMERERMMNTAGMSVDPRECAQAKKMPTKLDNLNTALRRLQLLVQKADDLVERMDGNHNSPDRPMQDIEFSMIGLLSSGPEYIDEIHSAIENRLNNLEAMLFD